MKMNSIKSKELLKKVKKFFGAIGEKINLNTWFFTTFFFVCVLVVSLFVWWQCVHEPVPSSKVLIKMEQEKENYNEMKVRTEEVIRTLQENRDRFDNPPFYGNQRELFLEIDLENIDGKDPIIPKAPAEQAEAEQQPEPQEDIVP